VKHSGTDQIRAELAWITETPDPTNVAVAIFDAVKRRDTNQALAQELLPRSSGRSGGEY